MLEFEIINELTLKVICKGNDVLFTKAGAFILTDAFILDRSAVISSLSSCDCAEK